MNKRIERRKENNKKYQQHKVIQIIINLILLKSDKKYDLTNYVCLSENKNSNELNNVNVSKARLRLSAHESSQLWYVQSHSLL